ncbi:MAG: signal peptidase I [Proteobacteria bacterium]|nr:signal peptidase I [Pseudomonadota bacterium]
MILDFTFYLTLIVVITGIVSLIDVLFFAKKRHLNQKKPPTLVEYARAFFPVLLLVLVIRSFVVQPYRVPSSSLAPTVLPGDFIAVKQYQYGLRLPVTNTKILNISEPKHGQIFLFRFPLNPKITFVKRVIGVPGDHIQYKDKVLYINGVEQKQKLLAHTHYIDENGVYFTVDLKEENLEGVKHMIYVQPEGGETQDIDVVVPAGKYFAMGDNRDNSGDSRIWGFVPEANLIGQAFWTFMSWDGNASGWNKIRWNRIGKAVN